MNPGIVLSSLTSTSSASPASWTKKSQRAMPLQPVSRNIRLASSRTRSVAALEISAGTRRSIPPSEYLAS